MNSEFVTKPRATRRIREKTVARRPATKQVNHNEVYSYAVLFTGLFVVWILHEKTAEVGRRLVYWAHMDAICSPSRRVASVWVISGKTKSADAMKAFFISIKMKVNGQLHGPTALLSNYKGKFLCSRQQWRRRPHTHGRGRVHGGPADNGTAFTWPTDGSSWWGSLASSEASRSPWTHDYPCPAGAWTQRAWFRCVDEATCVPGNPLRTLPRKVDTGANRPTLRLGGESLALTSVRPSAR
jgi:hypothetical protein